MKRVAKVGPISRFLHPAFYSVLRLSHSVLASQKKTGVPLFDESCTFLISALCSAMLVRTGSARAKTAREVWAPRAIYVKISSNDSVSTLPHISSFIIYSKADSTNCETYLNGFKPRMSRCDGAQHVLGLLPERWRCLRLYYLLWPLFCTSRLSRHIPP